MAEFIINPHSVELAHPRFRVRVCEYLRFWILHISVNGHAKTAFRLVCPKYSEIVNTETAVIPFVGIVVLYNHFLCSCLINWFNQ